MQYEESKYRDKFIVGVDFGETTTGLALGKNGAVTPVSSVESKDRMRAIQEIVRLAKENRASKIIIGLPLSYELKETKESIEARRFAKLLQTKIGIPVGFIDEFGSTKEAIHESLEEELPQKTRKRVDSISASIILKRFFSDEGL